ncbi:MucR family transcriptional regulator [Candidatus Bealeia paramacronuclearis]|uniref:MucR family transcriptional regulator n=1 Tax=Candidatus Bealeia paramacronuclearis TaxID=1921001 RepID=A0ABZ2C3D9_9PROT|nr:MucR family transcriptional regulator [Candidatus Bealeia paramacronuclearis]
MENLNFMTQTGTETVDLTAEIVAAYLSNNEMSAEEVPGFIRTVHASLNDLSGRRSHLSGRPDPVVAIEDSVQDDHIVCLEDGRRLKMLKRHLKTAYNMTPEQYRERWDLPADYPMVAPQYARKRSSLAKDFGLGTRRDRRKDAA